MRQTDKQKEQESKNNSVRFRQSPTVLFSGIRDWRLMTVSSGEILIAHLDQSQRNGALKLETDDAAFEQRPYHAQAVDFTERADREDRLHVPFVIDAREDKRFLRRQRLRSKA